MPFQKEINEIIDSLSDPENKYHDVFNNLVRGKSFIYWVQENNPTFNNFSNWDKDMNRAKINISEYLLENGYVIDHPNREERLKNAQLLTYLVIMRISSLDGFLERFKKKQNQINDSKDIISVGNNILDLLKDDMMFFESNSNPEINSDYSSSDDEGYTTSDYEGYGARSAQLQKRLLEKKNKREKKRLEQEPYNLKEANKNVLNTINLFKMLDNEKEKSEKEETKSETKLPRIPQELVRDNILPFFDNKSLTNTMKTMKKIQEKEREEKRNKIEKNRENRGLRYFPPTPPGGGGYLQSNHKGGKRTTKKRRKGMRKTKK